MSMYEAPPHPSEIQRRNRKRAPLTYSQESLWFLQQLDPGNIAYNSNFLFKLTGGVDRVPFEKALNWIVRRHEPCRTIYPNEGGTPVQVVQPYKHFSLPYLDYSDLVEEEKMSAVYAYVKEHGDQPYNLQHGPLIRYALFHLSDKEDMLYYSAHHIGSDGWSRQIISNELIRAYDSYQSGKEPDLGKLPLNYTDYAIWQREWLTGKTLTEFISHWKNILSGELPILELPLDHPRPSIQTYQGTRYQIFFPEALVSQLKAFCQKERITLFQLLFTNYVMMLMRYSGQEDIIIGCPLANRNLPETDNLVGMFVNTLPIRINLSGNPGVRELLLQVRDVMLDAVTWQAAPFEALVSEISPERDLSRTPIFQVAINMRNIPNLNHDPKKGLEIENVLREDVPAPFDLSLEFDYIGGSMLASFQYNADLFDENTIIHMGAHYQNLLKELLVKANRPISELEMLTPSERKRILFDWNETGTDFPQVCVHDLIAEQSRKDPDAIAIVCNGKSLSYGDLESKANQLAQYIRKKGVQAETRVGIYLPRSEKMVIALLAILKAGGVYVPLDMTYPAERIAYMVEDAAPGAIITLSHLESQLPEQFQKISLDGESQMINACETSAPKPVSNNNSPIYVMYTSGSTGRPKGAVIVHKSSVNYLMDMKKQFNFCYSDSMIQLTSLSFDLSVFEIFGFLSYGATLYLMDDDQMRDTEFINKTIIDQQVTCLSVVPTMLRALSESALARGSEKNCLRVIMPAGEALLRSDVELAKKAFGDLVQIVNLYGPTECSIGPTTYTVPNTLDDTMQIIPIGKPISNARTYVLDKYFNPVPVGTRGELFIGGIGVGLGYWNRPDLTAERFFPDPFWQGGTMYQTGDVVRQLPDGTLCFLGRTDNQVKIRGYRIELGEIEAVIAMYPGVKEAVVSLRQKEGNKTLIAHITLGQEDEEKVKEGLRSYLADRLPFYMVPSSIMVLDNIPLTPNGKIDRRSLPTPGFEVNESYYLAPRSDIEKRLVSIWEQLLNKEKIGVRDNFFDLGGHSLLAVRLVSQIHDEFGQSLPLLLLFKDSTIEALANALENKESVPINDGIMSIQSEGNEPPIFIICPSLGMRNLAMILGANRPVYGLFPYENGKETYRDSIQNSVKIYYQCLVDFYPQGPYLLIGHSAEGFYALELARLLKENGKKIAFVGLLDTSPPGPKQKLNQIERMKYHLGNLRKKNITEIWKYVKESLRQFFKRRRFALMDRKAMKTHTIEGQGKKQIKRLLVKSYKPELYDGPVTYFLAPSARAWTGLDPLEQWSNTITRPMEVVEIDGNHMTLLDPPHVDRLAEKILTILSRNEK